MGGGVEGEEGVTGAGGKVAEGEGGWGPGVAEGTKQGGGSWRGKGGGMTLGRRYWYVVGASTEVERRRGFGTGRFRLPPLEKKQEKREKKKVEKNYWKTETRRKLDSSGKREKTGK